MFESIRPVFGCECKQLLPMQQLRFQQRHGAGDYFPDSLKSSAIWGFRYQALQINYRALFVGCNEVLRELVHPNSCLASRIVVKTFWFELWAGRNVLGDWKWLIINWTFSFVYTHLHFGEIVLMSPLENSQFWYFISDRGLYWSLFQLVSNFLLNEL